MGLSINNTDKVKEQYSKTEGLSTRISIHEKYSTNKMGISNWNFTIYEIKEGMKVLELGCGTGSMWIEHKDVLARCSEAVISDFSEAMVKKAESNIGALPNVKYQVIDIQDIPFEDNYFDVVIANYMLYHVPDLDKALSEVSRVLKPAGHFYAGTAGEKGIMETICSWLGMDNAYKNTFSLENGGQKLSKYFKKVTIERYIDSLEVKELDDLMEYIYSGITFKNICPFSKEETKNILSEHMVDGVIKLPKDPGMFVAVKISEENNVTDSRRGIKGVKISRGA